MMVYCIEIEIFKKVYSNLIEKKSFSRDEINNLYPKRFLPSLQLYFRRLTLGILEALSSSLMKNYRQL